MKKQISIIVYLLIYMCAFACLVTGLGACGGKKAPEAGPAGVATPTPTPTPPAPQPPKVEEKYKRTPVIGARTMEDGRRVGGKVKGKLGEELTNVFFTFKVNKAEYADAYEGLKPLRGYKFLIAELTVKNAFDEPTPMWAEDFIIQWGDGDKDYGYPISKSTSAQMDEAYRLAVDESVTKTLVYEVPAADESREYSISYLEYYEDKVEGNLFYVVFTVAVNNT